MGAWARLGGRRVQRGAQRQPPTLPPPPPAPATYKQDLKPIFGTRDGTTIIFPGTGTGGWESALTNTLSPGDKVGLGGYGGLW